MNTLDNVNDLWGDELKQSIQPGDKLKIAASCFSIYAYEALKKELEQLDSFKLYFIFSKFVPEEVLLVNGAVDPLMFGFTSLRTNSGTDTNIGGR